MTFDPLIDQLTKDLKPVRRRRVGVDAAIMAAICAAELTLFFLVGAARPDMPMMMQQPTFWWRLASLGLIALISGALAIFSFNPAYSPRKGIRWLILAVAACLVVGLCIAIGQGGLSSIIDRLQWRSGLQCTYKMVALSIPPVIGLGILMRRGASTDARMTALLVGLGAAAWGAFVFVFACPFNDPVYIAVWYTVGCGIVTLLSRLLLPKITRW
jgi:hypothetical protein